ncbi:hypothetical protein HN385_06990 [archaeon]|jgi:hypothetical protein|nr:hypothetical protein [archaeon]MBT3451019.1 hypothetical protein [archaeon]MBT6868561.1 hypothetical protein [archaeon]MBT7193093.1 hypothetical protein [archaeon]MBT7380410.1 hypothetical protein [archaeon]
MEKFETKSVVVSRKPGKDKDGLWTAVLALFDENNPHLKAKVPFKTVEYEDIIKVRLRDLTNVSFYLMGNDLVINNLVHLCVKLDENTRVITLTGEQEL